MKLAPPEVVGPISPCSKQVRVRNFIANATITVLVNGASASIPKSSSWTDDLFDVGNLAPGDKVTATQNFNGQTSDPTHFPVVVQKLPTV